MTRTDRCRTKNTQRNLPYLDGIASLETELDNMTEDELDALLHVVS